MRPRPRTDPLDEPILPQVRRDFITLDAGQTVADSLASLRTRIIGEKIVYFYVIDAGGKLVGVVPTRRLLMSQPDTRIEELMVRDVVSLSDTATVLAAGELFAQWRFLALPVVDGDGKLIGVVDLTVFTEELSDVAERQAADDAFQLIGVKVEEARNRSPWIAVRFRFPWLLCNIAGGIACAFLAGRYEAFLDNVIVLALFIPVVLALSESVSIQSTTLTLQALHRGVLSWAAILRALRREFVTAALLGLACGGLVGLIAFLWKRQPHVSYALGSAIALSMVTACLLGVALPMAVRAVRGDPRIAAGPVVLAAADIATLSVYLVVSARIVALPA